jgi:hypothetical protein
VVVLRPAEVLLLFAGRELQEWQGGPCRAARHAFEEGEAVHGGKGQVGGRQRVT